MWRWLTREREWTDAWIVACVLTALLFALPVSQVAAQSFGGGAAGPTNRVLSVSGDLAAPDDGQVWYDTAGNVFRVRENGVSKNWVGAGGGGTHPVALGSDVSGVLPVANGGTNSSTALSGQSIMISNGTALVQGAAGTTTTVLHGNAAGAPAYSAVDLTTTVTGTLPIANGGTGSATQNFVDLTTGQSVAGNKEFTGAVTTIGDAVGDNLTLDVGTVTQTESVVYTKTAEAGIDELLWSWTVSDATGGTFSVKNATATDARFTPNFEMEQNIVSTQAVGAFTAKTTQALDTGTTPMMVIDFQNSDGSSPRTIDTRPGVMFRSHTEDLMEISYDTTPGEDNAEVVVYGDLEIKGRATTTGVTQVCGSLSAFGGWCNNDSFHATSTMSTDGNLTVGGGTVTVTDDSGSSFAEVVLQGNGGGLFGGQVVGIGGGGTTEAPTQTPDNQQLFDISARGYDNLNALTPKQGLFRWNSCEAWTTTGRCTEAILFGTDLNSTGLDEVFRMDGGTGSGSKTTLSQETLDFKGEIETSDADTCDGEAGTENSVCVKDDLTVSGRTKHKVRGGIVENLNCGASSTCGGTAFNPTATKVLAACTAGGTCNVDLQEANAVNGDDLIIMVGPNAGGGVEIDDVVGEVELNCANPCSIILGAFDTVHLVYNSDRWQQVSPVSDN